MCRISRSFGISLCSWLAVSLLMLAFGVCSRASAQSCQVGVASFFWKATCQGNAIEGTDADSLGQSCADAEASYYASQCNNPSGSWCYTGSVTGLSCSPSGAPTGTGQSSTCNFSFEQVYECGSSPPTNCSGSGTTRTSASFVDLSSVSMTPSTCSCSTTANLNMGSASTSTAPTSMCSGGCLYNLEQGPNITLPGTTGFTATYTGGGALCAQSPPAGVSQGNCLTGGGHTFCTTNDGSGCASIDGVNVCPDKVPAGGCANVGGGVACSPYQTGAPESTPPAPNNGTSGTVATPTATVVDGGSSGQSTTAYYYDSSVVSSSTVSSVTTNNTSSSSSGGGGSVPTDAAGNVPVDVQPSAGNGDCGATGVDCSQAGNPLPSYDWSSDSWAGALTSFWNAVAAGPIASAVSGISANWPSGGSCPAETVTLTTLNYKADYGTEFCSLWQQSALPVLQPVMLAVWSITAVFIFLSA